LVVSFVSHYKYKRWNEYTWLVYYIEDSDECREWIGRKRRGKNPDAEHKGDRNLIVPVACSIVFSPLEKGEKIFEFCI